MLHGCGKQAVAQAQASRLRGAPWQQCIPAPHPNPHDVLHDRLPLPLPSAYPENGQQHLLRNDMQVADAALALASGVCSLAHQVAKVLKQVATLKPGSRGGAVPVSSMSGMGLCVLG